MRLGRIGRSGWLAVAAAVLWSVALPGAAQSPAEGGPTAAMDDQWHFTVAPYFWMRGVVRSLWVACLPTVPVDASILVVLENFDLGFQGHFDCRRNRLGLALDFDWTDLDVPAAETQVGTFTVDVLQVISEGFVFYRA